MGKYMGVIRKNARRGEFGEIRSTHLPGLTAFFDVAAEKSAKGPGGIIKGTRVTFDIDGRGRAVNLIKSYSQSDKSGKTRKYQSLPA